MARTHEYTHARIHAHSKSKVVVKHANTCTRHIGIEPRDIYKRSQKLSFCVHSLSLSLVLPYSCSAIQPPPKSLIPIPVMCMCNEGELSGTQDAVHWHTIFVIYAYFVFFALALALPFTISKYCSMYRLIWVLCTPAFALTHTPYVSEKWNSLLACLLLFSYTTHHITYPYLYEINVCTFNANWFLFDSIRCVCVCVMMLLFCMCRVFPSTHVCIHISILSKVLEYFRRKVKYLCPFFSVWSIYTVASPISTLNRIQDNSNGL